MNHVRVLKTFDLYESRKHNTRDMIDLWIILMFSSKTDNTHTHIKSLEKKIIIFRKLLNIEVQRLTTAVKDGPISLTGPL